MTAKAMPAPPAPEWGLVGSSVLQGAHHVRGIPDRDWQAGPAHSEVGQVITGFSLLIPSARRSREKCRIHVPAKCLAANRIGFILKTCGTKEVIKTVWRASHEYMARVSNPNGITF